MKFGPRLLKYMRSNLTGLNLKKVLENAVLRPWHPEFSSCKHEFWVCWLASKLYKKVWVLFDTTFRASFRLNKMLENAVPSPWHPEFSSYKHEFWVFW